MWPLPVRASFGAGLAWALLTVSLGMDLSLQESLLLKSLGLSVKPSPKIPIPVPSVLWRIFQKRKSSPATNRDPVDGCRVEEFNVPGNIIRVFADQGTEMLPFESCLLKASLWSGLGMAGGGQSSSQKWFLRPVLPVYGLICERVVGNNVRVQAPCFGWRQMLSNPAGSCPPSPFGPPASGCSEPFLYMAAALSMPSASQGTIGFC